MKKYWKRAAAMGMVCSLMTGLCACGGKGGGSSENAALAKENVYRIQEFEIPELEGDDFNVRSTFRMDGTSYIMAEVYNWSSDNFEPEIKILAMDESTMEVKVNNLELPKTERPDATEPDGSDSGAAEPEGNEGDGEAAGEPDKEGADTSTDTDADGAESGDEEAATDIDDDFAVEPETGYDVNNTWESTDYGTFVFSKDGKIYGIKNYNFEDYNDPENYISVRKAYVCCWDLEGRFQWESELNGLYDSSEEEWVYVNTMLPGADGSLNLLLGGDASYLIEVSAEGEVSDRKALSEEFSTMLNNCQSLLPREDGSLLIIYSDEDDWTKQYLNTYDLANDKAGEPSDLPSNFLWNYNNIMPGTNSDLLYCSGSGVYTYNRGDEEGKMMMSFINSDLNINNFIGLSPIDDKSFLGVFYENYDRKIRAGIFNYVDPKDIPDKSVLVLAGNYIGGDLKQRIVEYNRANENYRIVVKEYSNYNSYEDYNAGTTKLNNDIITGGMPDMLVADGLPVENYIAKGLIADIGGLIEKDEELSQVEFLQNVFDAYSVNEKLYYIVPSFYVRTVMAKKALVGDRQQWTMEDMQQVLATMPEGAQAFGDRTRDSFFNLVMQYCGSDFIDVATGKCSFDSPNFISMMEFAKTLPEEITYDEDYWMSFNYESQYREDKTLLCDTGIGSVSNLNYMINGYFGEEVSFIGFPTESGKGSFISSYDSLYCISSKSKNAEEAWNFLRYYLTDEYQDEIGYGLPVQKDAFLAKAQEATEQPFYLDENGEKVSYDESFYLNGEEIPLPPMSQEQVDQITAFIQTVDKAMYSNDDVLNIINEEMGAFYSGQKSAEDVAKVIQSRAQVYVDENR